MKQSMVVGFAVALGLGARGAAAQDTDCGEACADSDGGVGELSRHHDDDYGIDVDCRALNDFGYVATAQGRLHVASRAGAGTFSVRGELKVNARFIEDPDRVQKIEVQGTAYAGQYVNADVITGSDDLRSMSLLFQNPMSYIASQDGTQYQTDCSHSDLDLPRIADLSLRETLRFSDLPDGQQRAQIDVSNSGTIQVIGPVARVRVAGLDLTGTLYDQAGASNTLEPGAFGYIQVDVPARTFSRCSSYGVILDLDHTLQSGPFDPFADDSGTVSSPCLRWGSIITEDALGGPVDPLLQYKSLQQIVGSEVIARADNQRCSTCHYPGAPRNYQPPAGSIAPTQLVGPYSWSSIPGWVDSFRASSIKPEYLKQAFQRWRDDGAQ